MDRERNIQVKQVHFYQIKHILGVATILNQCGKDMADKYDLHHWDNPMFKSVLIVCMRLLENKVFLVVEGKCPVATFQIREEKDALFFEKLAVSPAASGKGYGTYCINLMEKKAKKLGLRKMKMEVYEKSTHAINFYLHKGYEQVGTTGTLKYCDIIMEKELK